MTVPLPGHRVTKMVTVSICCLTGSTHIQPEMSICVKRFEVGNEPETQKEKETQCRSSGLTSSTIASNLCAFSFLSLDRFLGGFPKSTTKCFPHTTTPNTHTHWVGDQHHISMQKSLRYQGADTACQAFQKPSMTEGHACVPSVPRQRPKDQELWVKRLQGGLCGVTHGVLFLWSLTSF